MALLIGVLCAALVLAIAGIFVFREANRLALRPPEPVFRLDEAFDWVVQHVPDAVAATLTPDDVKRILALQVEFMKRKGVAVNGSRPEMPGRVIIGSAETVQYIIDSAAASGEVFTPEQVHAVVETQLAYMRAIGAVSGPAGPAGPVPPDVS